MSSYKGWLRAIRLTAEALLLSIALAFIAAVVSVVSLGFDRRRLQIERYLKKHHDAVRGRMRVIEP